MQDISAFGIRLRLTASVTFPAGITITAFADDADALTVEPQEINATAMGVNGDLISWSRANPLPLVINVIPNSEDDRNLQVLLEANRVGRGKRGVRDVIVITAVYPDGSTSTWSNGVLTNGRVGNAIASAGRLQTKPYTFSFEAFARTAVNTGA